MLVCFNRVVFDGSCSLRVCVTYTYFRFLFVIQPPADPPGLKHFFGSVAFGGDEAKKQLAVVDGTWYLRNVNLSKYDVKSVAFVIPHAPSVRCTVIEGVYVP